jgi:phosphoribosylaminoimidazole-succinocarboxamide synthase
MQAINRIEISGLEVFSQGKVRTVYDLGDRLLIVATDRISAFDWVLPSGIPDKGAILNTLSAFWFKHLEPVSPHHMISNRVADYPESVQAYSDLLRNRSMLVHKARRIDVECIVRGYLAGSALKEYMSSGRVLGHDLPAGLGKHSRLPEPIFTPSTKSDDGHDENITLEQMIDLVGAETSERIKARSLELYDSACSYAAGRGITILDTKFEFGYLDGEIILIDEIFTPDSSRFLVKEQDAGEINLDKQFVRDFLEGTDWDKNSPPPPLPDPVVEEARRRYIRFYEKLTGEEPGWLK